MALLNTAKTTLKQLQLVKDIIKYFDAKAKEKDTPKETAERWGRHIYMRKELKEAHKALTGHTATPYFIGKNEMAKAKDQGKTNPYGSYRVDFFLAYAEKHPPKAEEPKAEKPTTKKAPEKKAKKEKAPKKEAAKGKKKAPKKEKAPAEETAEQPTTEGVQEEQVAETEQPNE